MYLGSNCPPKEVVYLLCYSKTNVQKKSDVFVVLLMVIGVSWGNKKTFRACSPVGLSKPWIIPTPAVLARPPIDVCLNVEQKCYLFMEAEVQKSHYRYFCTFTLNRSSLRNW